MKAGTEGVQQGLLLTELLLQSDEVVQDINSLLVSSDLLLQLMAGHEREAIKCTPDDVATGLVCHRATLACNAALAVACCQGLLRQMLGRLVKLSGAT